LWESSEAGSTSAFNLTFFPIRTREGFVCGRSVMSSQTSAFPIFFSRLILTIGLIFPKRQLDQS
jgi:hypothetical protein